jgi:hypothetical protein
MSGAALKIVEPQDPAASLRAERAKIEAQKGEAHRKLGRLSEAQKEEERVFAEIAALGQREIAALREWASSDMTGSRPEPETAERARLARAMARAVDATKAAKAISSKAISSEVENETAQLQARLGEIDTALAEVAHDDLLQRFVKRVDHWAHTRAAAAREFAELMSLPVALAEAARGRFNRGGAAQKLFQVAEIMRSHKIAEPAPTELEIAAAMQEARREIARVLGGPIVGENAVASLPALHSREELMRRAERANVATNELQRPST